MSGWSDEDNEYDGNSYGSLNLWRLIEPQDEYR